MVGLTNLPELSIYPFTDSAFGIARNPWDRRRTPGGSSGGSAAAVASAMVPIAHGTDGLGSVRIPAAACGLLGFKPGPGVVPAQVGADSWGGVLENGPLATTVADAALMLEAMAGARFDLAEPSSLRIAASVLAPGPGIVVHRSCAAAVRQCAGLLASLGHTVETDDPAYPLWATPALIATWFAAPVGDAQPVPGRSGLERRTRRHVARASWCGACAALPSIREHLHASLQGLQWTVNAYTLTFAVLLLTGATLGERYGRRRMFVIGLGLFTAGSAAAALAPGIGALVAARAIQGVGAAMVIPLTLTLLSAAVTPQRRGLALGAWGAVGGLAIAIGPLVGGAVVEGASWQWIFWLNVPIGIALLPIAWTRLTESRGPATSLDLPGLVLASVGLLGIVYGVVRGNDHGWTSATVLPPLVLGAALVAAFVAWELRAREPMLPMHLFRSRGFTMTNAASLLMFFGMFGSIFLLAQFLQVVQHYSPLQAGLRTLPWTGTPVLIAPVAGALSDRIGGRPLLATGLALQAIGLGWLAAVASPTVAYTTMVPAFVIAGIGMSLFFAPVANVVLSSVRRDQEGIASGANNAIRELGGVFGIAVLGAVFSAHGSYLSGTAFVSGLAPAVWVGGAAVAVASAAALLLPRMRQATAGSPAAGQARELEMVH